MHVRKSKVKDRSAVLRIARKFASEIGLADKKAMLEEHVGTTKVIVACNEDDKPVGFTYAYLRGKGHSLYNSGRNHLYVSAICVDSKHHQKGAATAMMNELVASNAHRLIHCDVQVANGVGVKLMHKVGFNAGHTYTTYFREADKGEELLATASAHLRPFEVEAKTQDLDETADMRFVREHIEQANKHVKEHPDSVDAGFVNRVLDQAMDVMDNYASHSYASKKIVVKTVGTTGGPWPGVGTAAISEKVDLPGGLADGRADDEFDEKQLEMGIKVEMEHTDDPEIAKDIAKDHLVEIPDYYTYLEKMEKEARESGEEKETEMEDLQVSGSKRLEKKIADLSCSPSQQPFSTQICPPGCKWDGTYDKCVKKGSKLWTKLEGFRKEFGKWGYGPYDSDTALDFAWRVERDLLQEAVDMVSDSGEEAFEEVGVLLSLLTHIDNNSVDENKALYKELKEMVLPRINEWAAAHEEPQEAEDEFEALFVNLDNRILSDSGSAIVDETMEMKQEAEGVDHSSKPVPEAEETPPMPLAGDEVEIAVPVAARLAKKVEALDKKAERTDSIGEEAERWNTVPVKSHDIPRIDGTSDTIRNPEQIPRNVHDLENLQHDVSDFEPLANQEPPANVTPEETDYREEGDVETPEGAAQENPEYPVPKNPFERKEDDLEALDDLDIREPEVKEEDAGTIDIDTTIREDIEERVSEEADTNDTPIGDDYPNGEAKAETPPVPEQEVGNDMVTYEDEVEEEDLREKAKRLKDKVPAGSRPMHDAHDDNRDGTTHHGSKVYSKGDTVTISHKGKAVSGTVVKYQEAVGRGVDYYVVDAGEYGLLNARVSAINLLKQASTKKGQSVMKKTKADFDFLKDHDKVATTPAGSMAFNKEAVASTKKTQTSETTISNSKGKHNTVADWEKGASTKKASYTEADIADTIVEADGRNIFAEGTSDEKKRAMAIEFLEDIDEELSGSELVSAAVKKATKQNIGDLSRERAQHQHIGTAAFSNEGDVKAPRTQTLNMPNAEVYQYSLSGLLGPDSNATLVDGPDRELTAAPVKGEKWVIETSSKWGGNVEFSYTDDGYTMFHDEAVTAALEEDDIDFESVQAQLDDIKSGKVKWEDVKEAHGKKTASKETPNLWETHLASLIEEGVTGSVKDIKKTEGFQRSIV